MPNFNFEILYQIKEQEIEVENENEKSELEIKIEEKFPFTQGTSKYKCPKWAKMLLHQKYTLKDMRKILNFFNSLGFD